MGSNCQFNKDTPLGIKFSLLARSFKASIDEKFRDEELTAVQANTILTLSYLENTLEKEVTLKDLQQAQNLTHPTMIEIIKKLEAKGFVETSRSESDKRSRNIKTTSKANGLLKSIPLIAKEVYDQLALGIDENELEIMNRVVDKMILNAVGGDN